MKIRGFEVNTEAIGAGMYQMIQEKGEEAIVAFGMIPKWAIDTLRAQLRPVLIEKAAAQLHVPVEAYNELADEAKINEVLKDVEHHVCLGIYKAASEAGKMRC